MWARDIDSPEYAERLSAITESLPVGLVVESRR
jgi:hypothetical protein